VASRIDMLAEHGLPSGSRRDREARGAVELEVDGHVLVCVADPATFASVPALFVSVAELACWLPASRASRVQPSTALRYD
jgi:hypothetical protein